MSTLTFWLSMCRTNHHFLADGAHHIGGWTKGIEGMDQLNLQISPLSIFFLWDCVVYRTKVQNIPEVKQKVIDVTVTNHEGLP